MPGRLWKARKIVDGSALDANVSGDHVSHWALAADWFWLLDGLLGDVVRGSVRNYHFGNWIRGVSGDALAAGRFCNSDDHVSGKALAADRFCNSDDRVLGSALTTVLVIGFAVCVG